jgi:hypothetical protein
LARRAAADQRFHFHYVTAREMANLVKAAEAGWQGSVAAARDYLWEWSGQSSAELPMTAAGAAADHLCHSGKEE